TRPTLDEYARIELPHMRRKGWLTPGTIGRLAWSQDGEEVGSVGFSTHSDRIVFSYQTSGVAVTNVVQLCHTPCHFGGRRTWLLCSHCWRRAGVLVFVGRQIACRRCLRLPYRCQGETKEDRATRKLMKIQKRLGNPDYENVLDLYLPKPKRMRWRTYDRIVAK